MRVISPHVHICRFLPPRQALRRVGPEERLIASALLGRVIAVAGCVARGAPGSVSRVPGRVCSIDRRLIGIFAGIVGRLGYVAGRVVVVFAEHRGCSGGGGAVWRKRSSGVVGEVGAVVGRGRCVGDVVLPPAHGSRRLSAQAHSLGAPQRVRGRSQPFCMHRLNLRALQAVVAASGDMMASIMISEADGGGRRPFGGEGDRNMSGTGQVNSRNQPAGAPSRGTAILGRTVVPL